MWIEEFGLELRSHFAKRGRSIRLEFKNPAALNIAASEVCGHVMGAWSRASIEARISSESRDHSYSRVSAIGHCREGPIGCLSVVAPAPRRARHWEMELMKTASAKLARTFRLRMTSISAD